MPPFQNQCKGRCRKLQSRNPCVSVYDIFRPLMPGGQGVPPLSANENFRLLRGRKTDSMTVVSETSLKWAISHRWLQDLSFEWIQGTNLNLWSEGGRQTLLWGFVHNFFLHKFLQQQKNNTAFTPFCKKLFHRNIRKRGGRRYIKVSHQFWLFWSMSVRFLKSLRTS